MNETRNNEKTTAQDAEDLQQFVTFSIGEEVYGVEVNKVHQIIGMTKITHIPNSLEFMKGMINLRGTVVPVVDLRIKFQMEEKEYDEFTVILVVELKERYIGMIVDTVSDVLTIPIKSIQETPHFSAKIETDYIKGIGNLEEQLVIIIDVNMILTSEELDLIGKSEKAVPGNK